MSYKAGYNNVLWVDVCPFYLWAVASGVGCCNAVGGEWSPDDIKAEVPGGLRSSPPMSPEMM